MDSYVLTLFDDAGNPIPIPAIQGVGIKDIRRKETDESALEIELDDGRVFAFVVGAGSAVSTDAELYAAAAAGGVISLAPDADITVAETLTLPAGTVILGNGATIRRAAGFEGILFFLSAGCRLENFTIEGNRTAMVSPKWDKTIEISTRANCVIDGITINNANEGIIVYEDDVLVRGCTLYNCGGNGIHFSGANRTRVEDCVIIGANKKASQMGHSEGCIIWSSLCCETVVSNCWCEDGAAGFGAIDQDTNSNIKLIGNTVKDCKQAIIGRFTHSAPNDIQIIGNHFIDSSKIYVAVNSSNGKYPYTEGFVVSDNICENTRIEIGGVRGVLISGNTVRGDYISVDECPYSVISNNVVDHPAGIGIHTKGSPGVSISGNSVRCQSIGVYGSGCAGILIFGNVLRQSPHNTNTDCIKLNSCPEAAIDNNKLFVYYGSGITAVSNCRTMGNYVVVADSSQTAIRVYGGHSGYIVAQNMSNGTYSVATATGAVVANNITITSTAFVDVTYTLTNLTTDGFAKALTEDDFEFTLTAASGYSLPDAITVTMGGTALVSGKGYAYDKASGKVTVYRASGAVEVTGGAV